MTQSVVVNGNTRWLEQCGVGVIALALHLPLLLWKQHVPPATPPRGSAAISIVLLAGPSARKPRDAGIIRGASPTQPARRAPRRPVLVLRPAGAGDRAGTVPPAPGAPAAQPGAPPRAGNRTLDLTYRAGDDRAYRSALHERLQHGRGDATTPLERELARAQRPDCRTAYASLGLFAIPKLLFEASGAGCKW